jgi:hypothetical protein
MREYAVDFYMGSSPARTIVKADSDREAVEVARQKWGDDFGEVIDVTFA